MCRDATDLYEQKKKGLPRTGYTGIHYIHYTLLVVPNTEAALPCCSAMDTLWRRNERGLVIMCHALLMPADICEQTESFRAKAPEVSIAIGTKWWDLDSRAYFSFFLASAAVATALASLVASAMYEAELFVKFQQRNYT